MAVMVNILTVVTLKCQAASYPNQIATLTVRSRCRRAAANRKNVAMVITN